jgi:hypothetical protein
LQELLGAFLLSSVGALSIHLSPPVRATLLHKVGLWDAFCQVRPKPYVNLPRPKTVNPDTDSDDDII